VRVAGAGLPEQLQLGTTLNSVNGAVDAGYIRLCNITVVP
jgi:hypothetical protein